MRNDVPAALPLLALTLGLAVAPLLTDPRIALGGLAAIAILVVLRRDVRRATIPLFCALGVLLALQVGARDADERATFATFHRDRFVTIEAPLERDWASREESLVLRASRFTANGHPFETPIAIYVRFTPPEMRMESHVRVDGFLRLSDRGHYSASVKSPQLLAYTGELPRWHPRAWNRALANALERHADEHPDEVALAQSLVLGRGERLTEEMRESFRRGGTYHLLVFSGLQIAFAAGLLAAMLRWMYAPRASDWLLLAFAALAPLFIGPTASVSRASAGIALYALSRILKRPTSLENLWCVAAMLRLLLEPRDLTDPSFHLTYAGAGTLLFIGRHLPGPRWVALTIAAEVAISPLTLFHFHQYALGGALLTFVMAPLIFAMLVVSLFACVFPPLFEVIALLHRLCTMLNELGLSGYYAAPPLIALAAAAFCALAVIAAFRSRSRAALLVAVLAIPTLAAVVKSRVLRSVPRPRVTFFDVGQGDAIALRSGNQTLLIDGGTDSRLLPLLADRGIVHIDTIVLSHAHPDHCASLPAVIEHFGVERILVTRRRFRGECATRMLAAAARTDASVYVVRDGQTFAHGDFALTVRLADLAFRRAPENNNSVVLLAAVQRRRFLFTGDIEREGELALAGPELRADVLKVPHHGSRTSSSPSLLDSVLPRLAVISCGRRNLFGHPHPDVLERLGERRIAVWRTDRDGTIDVEIDEGRLYVRARRD